MGDEFDMKNLNYSCQNGIFFEVICYTICMKDKYVHARTCVYNIHYHMVWCVKYRRKVLTTEIEAALQKILNDVAEENGFTVDRCEVGEMDHVHCFISAPPKLSITFLIKHLKGTSGLRLFRQFPELREKLWRGELWNGSYFVETIGSTSEENVKRYIERQKNVQM